MAVSTRRRLAAREAGRAVATAVVGLPVGPLALDAEGGSYIAPPDSDQPDFRRMFSALCGPTAERLLCGPAHGSGDDDERIARDEADRLADGDGIQAAGLVHRTRQSAEAFVRSRGKAIVAVANALHDRGRIEPADVFALLSPAPSSTRIPLLVPT